MQTLVFNRQAFSEHGLSNKVLFETSQNLPYAQTQGLRIISLLMTKKLVRTVGERPASFFSAQSRTNTQNTRNQGDGRRSHNLCLRRPAAAHMICFNAKSESRYDYNNIKLKLKFEYRGCRAERDLLTEASVHQAGQGHVHGWMDGSTDGPRPL